MRAWRRCAARPPVLTRRRRAAGGARRGAAACGVSRRVARRAARAEVVRARASCALVSARAADARDSDPGEAHRTPTAKECVLGVRRCLPRLLTRCCRGSGVGVPKSLAQVVRRSAALVTRLCSRCGACARRPALVASEAPDAHAGRTVLRSYIMVAGGELVVQQAITTASVVWPQPGGRARKSALRETAQNMLRAVAVCAGASAGAAAVVFLRPPDSKSTGQWPTQIGIIAGDFSATWLVSYFTDAWVAEGDEQKP